MEFRKIFDTIPEEFDRYRTRYCPELFRELIASANVGPESVVLELGPGTGQATEPILRTGCSYYAIELGEHLAAKLRQKYGAEPNFHLVNDDFITHDFGEQRFDLIYSAATIQWIPEEIAFAKTFSAPARRDAGYDADARRLPNAERGAVSGDPEGIRRVFQA